jgi:hypothetical protein
MAAPPSKYPYTMSYIIINQPNAVLIQTTMTDGMGKVLETKDFSLTAGSPPTQAYQVMMNYLRQRVIEDMNRSDIKMTGSISLSPEDVL